MTKEILWKYVFREKVWNIFLIENANCLSWKSKFYLIHIQKLESDPKCNLCSCLTCRMCMWFRFVKFCLVRISRFKKGINMKCFFRNWMSRVSFGWSKSLLVGRNLRYLRWKISLSFKKKQFIFDSYSETWKKSEIRFV